MQFGGDVQQQQYPNMDDLKMNEFMPADNEP